MHFKTVDQRRKSTDLWSTAKRVEHIKEHKTRKCHSSVTWSYNVVSHLQKKKNKHNAFFFDQPFAGVEYPEGGGYLDQFLLGMRRWPLTTPSPL